MAGFLEEGKYIDVVHSGLTFIGYSWPGTKTTDPKWKLKKITVTDTVTKIEYALPSMGYNSVTNYFLFKWDDRNTITNWG